MRRGGLAAGTGSMKSLRIPFRRATRPRGRQESHGWTRHLPGARLSIDDARAHAATIRSPSAFRGGRFRGRARPVLVDLAAKEPRAGHVARFGPAISKLR